MGVIGIVIFSCLLQLCYGAALSETSVLYKKRFPLNKWRTDAIEKLWNERKAMDKTPLVRGPKLGGFPNLELFYKNESASRTGSIKHRQAWALFMWAILEEHVGEKTTVYEVSSGKGAVSDAFMARLVGLRFIALVPDEIEKTWTDAIEANGGHSLKCPRTQRMILAKNLTEGKKNRFFMNQYANLDRAEDISESGDHSHESVNIFHEILLQFRSMSTQNAPSFFVHPAQTGGLITSVGRYVQRYSIPTQVVLADSEFSVYFDYVVHGAFKNESGEKLWVMPGMYGVGYWGQAILGQTISLDPAAIDLAIKIPDLASVAAMHYLKSVGISCGPCSGVNFVALLHIAARDISKRVTVVTPISISSTSYENTYYNTEWIKQQFSKHGSFGCWMKAVTKAVEKGWSPLEIGKYCNEEKMDL
ncbi:hypothetical protein L596_019409 [Steinernema carpocapsae]|uniref:Tryptophan synthase beta chain-like PALP domain-containing protein n=1 Tax=Steinernema carpocapsae TaxID=34508 RepID=A0A4U5MQE8_STECR|nr:hypothetical protein L596_019409 [Steinernema carpocapsae]